MSEREKPTAPEPAQQAAQQPPPPDGISARATKAVGRSVFRLLTAPLRSKLFLLLLLATTGAAALIAEPALAQHLGGGGDTALAISPWALRVGISFIAAYVFAYLVRTVVKLALVVGGTLIAAAFVVHWLGIGQGLGLDEDGVKRIAEGAKEAATHAQHAADSLWAQIKPYLPSGGAAGVGLWRGGRQRLEG